MVYILKSGRHGISKKYEKEKNYLKKYDDVCKSERHLQKKVHVHENESALRKIGS